MMYGATGSLDISEIFKAIGTGQINKSVLVFGTVFVVAGLAFKLGAVPFHMWVPDVYHGAPTAVTLLIAGAPKLAAFAITIRLLVEGMSGLGADWQQMLVVLAIGSMLIGNVVAIAQSNLEICPMDISDPKLLQLPFPEPLRKIKWVFMHNFFSP